MSKKTTVSTTNKKDFRKLNANHDVRLLSLLTPCDDLWHNGISDSSTKTLKPGYYKVDSVYPAWLFSDTTGTRDMATTETMVNLVVDGDTTSTFFPFKNAGDGLRFNLAHFKKTHGKAVAATFDGIMHEMETNLTHDIDALKRKLADALVTLETRVNGDAAAETLKCKLSC